MTDITTFEELCKRTNWRSLRAQKRALLHAQGLKGANFELLEGLLNFIDAVQDLAHDHYHAPAYPVSVTEGRKA